MMQDVSTPVKAWVLFQSRLDEHRRYVESYSFDSKDRPISAHPLTKKESVTLANAMASAQEINSRFLHYPGLLPPHVLRIEPMGTSYALWYTPPQQVDLHFVSDLGIPNGRASIPALLWKAEKKKLTLHALAETTERPTLESSLYYAPFFNVKSSGAVCMGTVNINIRDTCKLEEFMQLWERYFFASSFSHLMGGHHPTKGNTVNLWKSLVNTDKPFPQQQLIKLPTKIKDLIV
ncbi:PRTRC system protein B [Olivibacter domesticus]|uniref:PRTRC system protein B n=2 Tax=Olivibacter domesticus TaxID=407022 RepID=A0A1H7IDB2_OLID1|nr:PRTRC system protein B [Olivibacter domesticus]